MNSKLTCGLKNILILSVFLAVVFGLSLSPNVTGAVFEGGDNIHITNLHRIDEDLYATGNKVQIDGYVGGDFCALAQEVYTSGEVAASQNVSAMEFNHSGSCDGTVRAFTFESTIDGYVGRSLLLFSYKAIIGNRAVIRRDVAASCYSLDVKGRIMGDLNAHADIIQISGNIDGTARLAGNKISVTPPAVIKGDLIYTSEHEIKIDTADGVVVLGNVIWELPELGSDDEEDSSLFKDFVLSSAGLLAAFLFGLILLFLFRRYAVETYRQLRTRPAVAMAAGFITILAGVISLIIIGVALLLLASGMSMISSDLALLGALLLVLSILMIPISLFTGLCSGSLFYLGTIACAPVLGFLFIRLVKKEPVELSKTQLLLGLVVIHLLLLLPYFGILIAVLASVIGAGGIVLGIRHCRPDSTSQTEIPPSSEIETDHTGPENPENSQ